MVDEDLGRWDTSDPPPARARVHAGLATLCGRSGVSRSGLSGIKGIPLSYCYMSLLRFPFKWAKTRGGFRVEWLGMEPEYNSYWGSQRREQTG